MRSNIGMTLALAGSLVALAAAAADRPINIKTDLEGQFFLVEQSGTANNPVVVVKRVDAGYEYYVKRAFDCAARTVQYLGEGESLEAVADSEPELAGSAIEPGSIPDQLARLLCPR